jgi:glycosyltransferase involved in cell wall biosynthesis
MPLPDDAWCRHKCGLKLLQYLAAGIPAIASPVGVNAEIIEPGMNGLLARDDEEWEAALRTLLADAELRRRMGVAGRKKVEEAYSVRAMAPRLATALREAGERDGGTRRGGRG